MRQNGVIDNIDDLKLAVERLSNRPLLALDCETTGLDPRTHQIILLTLGDDRDQITVDCRKIDIAPLTDLLEGNVPKVTHNGAFDAAMLRNLNIKVGNLLDTMLIEQLIAGGRNTGSLSLSALSDKYLGLPLSKSERLSFKANTGSFTPEQLRYAKFDVLAAYLVFLEQLPLIRQDELEEIARLECAAVMAFADLKFDGIFLDQQAWSSIIQEAQHDRDNLRNQIDQYMKPVTATDLFGRVDLNYESDAELKVALGRLTGQEPNEINKHTLKQLDHPVTEPLLKYRELSKIVSTYGRSFLDHVHPQTGRIHADFLQIGALTGRVSCSRPNLQNIPRGSRFRKCFRAPEGRSLITADYSGCELRILAQMSSDPAFLNTFQRGGDLHSIVASEIFSTSVSKKKNPELRDRAKAINFGLAYGMGSGGLAQIAGLTLDEANRLLARYFQAYPKVKQYLDQSAHDAAERGYAKTLAGRRLYLKPPQDSSEIGSMRRVAKNMPIQGTNADMLKAAMAGIRSRIRCEHIDGCMVNCVHDEILLEVDQEQAWELAEIVREEMIRAGQRWIDKVPLLVDVSVADTWQK